jgi:hypothetical protein
VLRARPGVETHFAGTAAPTTYITDSMRQLHLSGRTWTWTSLTLQGHKWTRRKRSQRP